MFVSDIIASTQEVFGDKAGVQIDEEIILRWINFAQTDIARKTECLYGIYPISSAVGDVDYALPSDFFKDSGVTYSGLSLKGVSYKWMTTFFPEFQVVPVQQGIPAVYYIFNGELNLYPAPVSVVTNGIVLTYVRIPALLTGTIQTPEIPSGFHELLVKYCHMKALQQDEQWPASDRLKQEYDSGILDAIHDTNVDSKESYPAVILLPGDF